MLNQIVVIGRIDNFVNRAKGIEEITGLLSLEIDIPLYGDPTTGFINIEIPKSLVSALEERLLPGTLIGIKGFINPSNKEVLIQAEKISILSI